ncbi:MAG: T9SS type A sorting domain-containing protein, partial [Candidatus Cloacimonetes bacterium]|nr:T9SS type A sorting domain-containing protein [Candidatus Cloacimonadota bacterium]
LKGDDIIVSGNKIHNEKSYDNMDMIYVSGYNITVKDNVIYDNSNSDLYSRAAIGCQGSYEFNPDSINIVNNTIVNNEYGIYCYDFSDGDQVKVKNNIIIDNFTGIKDNSNVVNIQYCDAFDNNTDYQGCSPGIGCISTDPIFADPANDDYSLTWNSDNISPCIDAGDPDMTGDADGTPPDIGAKTAVSHSYFNNQYDNEVLDNAEWISFPALNTITNGATEALFVLENQELINSNATQDDDILDYVEYMYIQEIWFDDIWHNTLGNFESKQGYKIQLRDDNDSIPIGITGIWEDPSEPIQLYANQTNWIGCSLEEPASISEAFSSIEDEWISIESEHWAVYRQIDDWNHIRGTVNPGELYIVNVDTDCELVWDDSGTPVDPYTKEKTDYFTYEKKLEYMSITVDTVYGDNPDEIAVYEGDECLGASKVDGEYPVQILAYPPDAGSKDGSIDFMLYYNNSKNKAKAVNNYTVYNTKFSAYVNKPVAYNQNNYTAVRLNTGENIDPNLDFAIFGNYPNPITEGVTHISFAPDKDAEETEIRIYNIRGQLVRELDCNKPGYNKEGLPTVSWDCKDSRGNHVQSGVYFYKLTSGKKRAVSKMVIVK